jgi:hypothetical protein
MGDFFKSFNTWLQSLVSTKRTETDINVAMGAKGIDLRTPCDAFINTNLMPNRACMEYLYSNKGATNKRIGPTYAGFTDYEKISSYQGEESFTEAFKTMVQASEGGDLNPRVPAAFTELTTVGLRPGPGNPYQKIKNHIQSTWDRSNDKTRDANIPDARGGRGDSWRKMHGIKIAEAKQATVSTNAKGMAGPPRRFGGKVIHYNGGLHFVPDGTRNRHGIPRCVMCNNVNFCDPANYSNVTKQEFDTYTAKEIFTCKLFK